MVGGNPDAVPDEQQPSSPFAAPSWEPRFALDGLTAEPGLLVMALGLYVSTARRRYVSLDTDETYRGDELGPSRLAVAVISRFFPYPLRDGDLLFEDASLPAAAQAMAHWLQGQATYPPQPWFDGGEERGFQAWHVPYGDHSGPMGYLIVEPKWFEVHK
jgi:hypothetical protein